MLRGSSGWISLPFLAFQYHNHQSQRHTAQRGQERHEATWIESIVQLSSWAASKSICWFGLYSKDANSWLLAVKTKESVHIVLHCFQHSKTQKPQRVIFVQSGVGTEWFLITWVSLGIIVETLRTSRVLGMRLALKDQSRQGQTLEIVRYHLQQKYYLPW